MTKQEFMEECTKIIISQDIHNQIMMKGKITDCIKQIGNLYDKIILDDVVKPLKPLLFPCKMCHLIPIESFVHDRYIIQCNRCGLTMYCRSDHADRLNVQWNKAMRETNEFCK